jgi:large subunit ribosomal protein L31e|tara:strand:+ start:171 stop:347 length:177 start_codon:yes stop_codon:yes gene_type:complete
MPRTKERKELENVTRDYTLNMHKRLQGVAFKKRATRAVRECGRFAAKEMHTGVSCFNN